MVFSDAERGASILTGDAYADVVPSTGNMPAIIACQKVNRYKEYQQAPVTQPSLYKNRVNGLYEGRYRTVPTSNRHAV